MTTIHMFLDMAFLDQSDGCCINVRAVKNQVKENSRAVKTFYHKLVQKPIQIKMENPPSACGSFAGSYSHTFLKKASLLVKV